ncbi:transporter [Thermaurantimonas aggregans]|uniref:Transporter n=1 Tax=Thermaurantimonas aggregans TaxID=2173829 RepID=A0A401XNJ2_9FLAO|nr:TolC family protein [Thermaurantimonas aggregans]MCX8148451.1 TolC family protein [Thermaurantimonas aggregans]GCD78586.1 transporter [Thermaurantimonas aggregans]
MLQKNITVLALSIGVFFQSFAQKPLGFEECLALAYSRNLSIKRAQLSRQRAESLASLAKYNLTPSLNGSFGYTFNFGLNIDPVRNVIGRETRQIGNIGFNTQWVLFDGLQNYHNIKRTQYNLLAENENIETAKNDLTLNLAQFYLQALVNEELLIVAEQQLELTEKQLKRTKELVDAGVLPEVRLQEIQAQYYREQQNVVLAKNNLDIALLQLANLMLYDGTESLRIKPLTSEIPVVDYSGYKPNDIYREAFQNNPSLKSARLLESAGIHEVKQALGTRFPLIALVAGISTNYANTVPNITGNQTVTIPIGVTQDGVPVFTTISQPVIDSEKPIKPFRNQVVDNVNEFLGISIQIPLWSRYQISNTLNNARINYELAKVNYQQAQVSLFQNVQQAHAQFMAAKSGLEAATKAERAARTAYENAEQRYTNGLLDQVQLESFKINYANAQSQLTRAKYEYIFRSKIIEFILTNTIKL